MKKSGGFTSLARSYARRHFLSLLIVSAVRWTPAGFLSALIMRFLSETEGLFPLWWCFPVLAVPPLVGIAVSVFGFRGVSPALSWLDSEIAGNQELQAAWEYRNSSSELSGLVLTAGENLLNKKDKKMPVPRPGTASKILSLTAGTAFVLMLLAGQTLFGPPDQNFIERGSEMKAWAESRAEAADGTGRPESRELAGRMEALGRRMEEGSIGERQAERALKALEEEIEERRDGLVRDKLAEALVEDLGIDRESADLFRVQRRRLPSDVLAELGSAAEGSPAISEMSKEVLDKLLSDPAFRDRMKNGTPELTEKLTQALQDALEPVDPEIAELDRAAEESRKARGEDPAGDEEGGPAEEPQTGQGENGNPGNQSAGNGGDDDSKSGGGQTGGGGRGTSAVDDEPKDSNLPFRSSAEEPLHLSSDTERSGSWRTVIRAYTEDGDADPTVDGTFNPEWRREVESVIHREDIPPGTRDYVRDYFMALEEGPETQDLEE